LDAASMPLWQNVTWLLGTARSKESAGPDGFRSLQRATARLRSYLAGRRDPPAEHILVGSPRWFGSGLRPRVFVLGARDSGVDMLSTLLLAQPSVCGGQMRLFDDDLRYINGLSAASSRITRRPVPINSSNNGTRQLFLNRRTPASACSLLVDTTSYLHSRWAPLRIHSVLQEERSSLRFLVVLRDPVERAFRHWRLLLANAARPLPRHAVKRGAGDSKPSDLHRYINGSSFTKKMKQEALQLRECFDAHQGGAGVRDVITYPNWEVCMTLACNWLECVMGTGLYAPQLLGWLQYFNRDQFLVLQADEMILQPTDAIRRVSKFLGVPLQHSSTGMLASPEHNITATVGEQAKRLIQRFYSKHNKQVRAILSELDPAAGTQAGWLT